jgi:hypothetical protein
MADTKVKSKEELLQEQVAELQAKLAASETGRTDAEKMAQAMAEATQFVGGNAQEQPTGKTIVIRTCSNPWVRDEKKQKWVELEKPTYFFTLNLPVSAMSLSTNGVEYYHGQTYEFDGDTLAEMKSRVARCWDHEASINGSNENAYRKQTQLRVG